MQAQVPSDPYVGLWSRLDGFRPADLSELLERRDVVRMPFLRATLHLVTRRDALALRPVVDAVLDRALHSQSPFGRAIAGVDVDEVSSSMSTPAIALLHSQSPFGKAIAGGGIDELTSFASALLAEPPRT